MQKEKRKEIVDMKERSKGRKCEREDISTKKKKR